MLKYFSATTPFQVSCSSLPQSPRKSSFDKTQKGETLPLLSSLPRNSSVSFLERNWIPKKLSLWEEPRQAYCWFWKSNKPLQFRISTKVFTVLKEVSSICWSQKICLLFLKHLEIRLYLLICSGFPHLPKTGTRGFLQFIFKYFYYSEHFLLFTLRKTTLQVLWSSCIIFFTTPHANCFFSCVPEINSTLETHQNVGHDPSCYESHCWAFPFPFHALLLTLPGDKSTLIHSANIHNESGCHSDQDHQGYQ